MSSTSLSWKTESKQQQQQINCKDLKSVEQWKDVQLDWAACGDMWDWCSYSQGIFGFVQSFIFETAYKA